MGKSVRGKASIDRFMFRYPALSCMCFVSTSSLMQFDALDELNVSECGNEFRCFSVLLGTFVGLRRG